MKLKQKDCTNQFYAHKRKTRTMFHFEGRKKKLHTKSIMF